MARARTFIRLTGLLVALGLLAACSKGYQGELQVEKATAAEIYQRAEFELTNGKAKDAAHYFGEIERLYPYSDWGKRALIMQAFSYHKARKFDDSRASAQRYLDFYPADEDAAYAQYLVALSYYDQIDDVGRDQELTTKALQALRRVIEKYPDSEYAKSAVLKFDLAFDRLGGKEMEVGRYYLKHRNYAAAINRFRTVVENFQTTTNTPEALYRLVEAYMALGLDDEARTAAAILGHNYAATDWYKDAHALLNGKGIKPGAAGNSWLAKVYRQMLRGEWL